MSPGARAYGAELRDVATASEITVCTVVVPRDACDAAQRMIAGLKLTIPDELPDAEVVRGEVAWRIRRLAVLSDAWDVPRAGS